MKTILTLIRNSDVNNPYGFKHIDIIQFNYDSKGSALIIGDGILETATEKNINELLFGGDLSKNDFEMWYVPSFCEMQVINFNKGDNKADNANSRIRLVSKATVFHRRLLFQQWRHKIKLQLDDIVKIEITDGEHGYVRIVRIDKNKVWGKINIDPISTSKKYDEIIEFSKYDIEEVEGKIIFINNMEHFKEMRKNVDLLKGAFNNDNDIDIEEIYFIDNVLLVVNNDAFHWIPRKEFAERFPKD